MNDLLVFAGVERQSVPVYDMQLKRGLLRQEIVPLANPLWRHIQISGNLLNNPTIRPGKALLSVVVIDV